jgi:hypothetical protein
MKHVRITVVHATGKTNLTVDAAEDNSPVLTITATGVMRFYRTESDGEGGSSKIWLLDIPVVNVYKIEAGHS